MRKDAIPLEEMRLQGVEKLENYQSVHERHRIFPEIFEDRNHKMIMDLSAGVGIVANRVKNYPDSRLICNDVSPTCLKILRNMNMNTLSFDLDIENQSFPFDSQCFDALISLSTIEHLLHVDHFLSEVNRILKDNGYLYISSPNYASIFFTLQHLFTGRTFHDPLSKSSGTRYEFYAHVRYFTYRTLVEYICSFNFSIESVYLAAPGGSTYYNSLKRKSEIKAFLFRNLMRCGYTLFSPRWAPEPVLCFRKNTCESKQKFKKVVL